MSINEIDVMTSSVQIQLTDKQFGALFSRNIKKSFVSTILYSFPFILWWFLRIESIFSLGFYANLAWGSVSTRLTITKEFCSEFPLDPVCENPELCEKPSRNFVESYYFTYQMLSTYSFWEGFKDIFKISLLIFAMVNCFWNYGMNL